MRNIKIFQLLSDDKEIAAMQQHQSLLVPSKSDSQDSSSSPLHQEDQSRRQQNQQQQVQAEELEQKKVRDESSKKRKRECDMEAIRVETPRKSSIRCYDDPPEPPRKPKASPATKRRVMWVKRSVVFLDVANEVESMFPPSLLQDFGKKIKKAIS